MEECSKYLCVDIKIKFQDLRVLDKRSSWQKVKPVKDLVTQLIYFPPKLGILEIKYVK